MTTPQELLTARTVRFRKAEAAKRRELVKTWAPILIATLSLVVSVIALFR